MGGLTLVPMEDSASSLFHYGVKGQRWGVRRYQNADGSLTKAGQKKMAKKIVMTRRKGANTDSSEEIQKAKEAFYYFIKFESENSDCSNEVEAHIRIMEPVVRYLCVKQDEQ